MSKNKSLKIKAKYVETYQRLKDETIGDGQPVTQSVMAEALGVSQAAVSDYLHGKYYMAPWVCIGVSKKYRVSLADLNPVFEV